MSWSPHVAVQFEYMREVGIGHNHDNDIYPTLSGVVGYAIIMIVLELFTSLLCISLAGEQSCHHH